MQSSGCKLGGRLSQQVRGLRLRFGGAHFENLVAGISGPFVFFPEIQISVPVLLSFAGLCLRRVLEGRVPSIAGQQWWQVWRYSKMTPLCEALLHDNESALKPFAFVRCSKTFGPGAVRL